jgi:ABC-type amino acid transport substrate-binding protein/ABC-type amino acid transport system permease subunit
MNLIKIVFEYFLYIIILITGNIAFAKSDAPYEKKLVTLLENSRSQNCGNPDNELTSILCAKKIKIGIRTNYPGFGESKDGKIDGYEIKAALEIAKRLGVIAELLPVTPANRIEKLLKGEVDMVLATMAHTTSRDQIIHFVRPHYYSSPTSIAGPKKINASGWSDLAGRSVCVPLGNFSNILFSEHQVRMMIYDRPDRMVDAFNMGACSLIAHDQSYLFGTILKNAQGLSGGNAFEEKFSFNEVPWGIGVKKTASENLGLAIGLIIADMHQSGRLLDLTAQSEIQKTFLEKQQTTWANPNCFDALDVSNGSDCLLMPVNLADQPSPIEGTVSYFEVWLDKTFNIKVRFPMLSGVNGLKMFLSGMVISVFIVLCAIGATLIFSFIFYFISKSKIKLIQSTGSVARLFFQNSPLILLLMLGYLSVTAFLAYSTGVAVLIAIAMIGLNNGANGGNALMDAAKTFPSDVDLKEIIGVASVPIRAAVINAAKASPVAAFIGAPEMLSSLTDITSFTGERITTYLIVAVFYIFIVQTVVLATGIYTKRVLKNV